MDQLKIAQHVHQAARGSRIPPRRGRFGWKIWFPAIIVACVTCSWFLWSVPQEIEAKEIFRGVTYTTKITRSPAEIDGWVHIVQVDLDTPGLELFTTPVDDSITSEEWKYRLALTSSCVKSNNLSVAINAAQFSSNSFTLDWQGKIRSLYLPGDLAQTNELVVSDYEANPLQDDIYLLWFDNTLTPKLERAKPPPADVLKEARWGVGSLSILVQDGKLLRDRKSEMTGRTAIGIDPEKKLLWLAVCEKASPRAAGNLLIEHGAKDVVLLDGGTSSSMALGRDAHGVRSGGVMGGWRPVATHFGIRAPVLRKP